MKFLPQSVNNKDKVECRREGRQVMGQFPSRSAMG